MTAFDSTVAALPIAAAAVALCLMVLVLIVDDASTEPLPEHLRPQPKRVHIGPLGRVRIEFTGSWAEHHVAELARLLANTAPTGTSGGVS